MLSRTRNRVLVVLLVVAIAISGVSAYLLNNHSSVASSSQTLYRYRVKFECGWQRVVIHPPFESQWVPVETYITTQVNVFNPNHDLNVTLYKYFCKTYPEHSPWGDCTNKTYSIVVPANKGFDIDCDDVQSWPNFPVVYGEAFWKGFVVIECTLPSWALPLEVVAVYNKESAEVVNKITFHIEPILTIETPVGTFKPNEPYEISVRIPPEMDGLNATALEDIVHAKIPFEPDIDIEIVSTTSSFDFLKCARRVGIVFIPRATDEYWKKWLNVTWPPYERPPGFVWPDWFRPCTKIEKIYKPLWIDFNPMFIPEDIVRDEITSRLIDLGVPPEIIDEIMRQVRIQIIDVDVGEGVGTSIDVEYIEPEIIEIVP